MDFGQWFIRWNWYGNWRFEAVPLTVSGRQFGLRVECGPFRFGWLELPPC